MKAGWNNLVDELHDRTLAFQDAYGTAPFNCGQIDRIRTGMLSTPGHCPAPYVVNAAGRDDPDQQGQTTVC
jgi:hypothetical protein